jgi:hypothetical protein
MRCQTLTEDVGFHLQTPVQKSRPFFLPKHVLLKCVDCHTPTVSWIPQTVASLCYCHSGLDSSEISFIRTHTSDMKFEVLTAVEMLLGYKAM